MIYDKEKIEFLRKAYPTGSRVELLHMEDFNAVPTGTKGIIRYIDDIGTIHVDWNNRSSLGIVYGIDSFKIIK